MNILGLGHASPAGIIDNAFLAELGADVAWIEGRIGIEARRTVLPLDYLRATRNVDPRAARSVATETPTDLGARAARMALERAGLSPQDVGLVLANCCTPEETVPAESQRIARELEIAAPAYDVFGACPAFALHLSHLDALRPDRAPDVVLCVSTATFTTVVEYTPGSADAAILGDGAAAWVVSHRRPGSLRVLDAAYHTDASKSRAIVRPEGGHFRQDGRAVRSFSVRRTVEQLAELNAKWRFDWARDRFVGHQANAVMLESVCRAAKIPPGSHWSIARELGNMAGAGAPATLSSNEAAFEPGMRVVVALVGAGLGWGHAVLEVA